jgi:IclR helix-turn-helix domain
MIEDEVRDARAGLTAEVDGPDEGEAHRRRSPVCVELTSAQVENIIRTTADTRAPSLSLVLSGLIAERAISQSSLERRYWAELEGGRLSHSLFRGLLILALFLSGEQGRGVVDVARQLGLSPSTTHRYISTLVAFGLLVQDPSTRKYRLPR